MSGPTDRELLNRLIEAIKPLAFSAAENPPPGIDPDDWHHAVAAARKELAAAQYAIRNEESV